MNPSSPILVTGSPRSGTTWVGKMIAASSIVGYIWEPFNLSHRPGVCGAEFPYWFTHVSEKNEAPFYEHLKHTLSFRYGLHRELRALRSIRDVWRMIKQYRQVTQFRRVHRRPLMKDPCALFSAEWLAKRFNMQVVIMIRHPMAFACSMDVLKWPFPFLHLLKQPLLMETHLHPFEGEIQEYATHTHSIMDQALLAWRLFYHTIHTFKNQHPTWIFVRQEDLAKAPLEGFEALYTQLGLPFTETVRQIIVRHTRQGNPRGFPGAKTIIRDSRATIATWKARYSKDERTRMKASVEDISRFFYSDSDW